MKIAVLTSSDILYQKIYLALAHSISSPIKGAAEVKRVSSASEALGCEICLFDNRALYESDLPEGMSSIMMGEGGDLPIPFSFDELYSVISDARSDGALLLMGDKCAILRGEHIPLTDVEFSLFSCLYRARGEFVSREELLNEVWRGDADCGVVNVYVYYLRQKLERGEKIISTSRKLGYKIDERYF